MADALNDEARRDERIACSVCQRVPLILFDLSAGKVERARMGCLCRSLILRPDARRGKQTPQQNTRRVRLL